NVQVPGDAFATATFPLATFGSVTPATGVRFTSVVGSGACGLRTKLPGSHAAAKTVSPVTVIVLPRAQRGNSDEPTSSTSCWSPAAGLTRKLSQGVSGFEPFPPAGAGKSFAALRRSAPEVGAFAALSASTACLKASPPS